MATESNQRPNILMIMVDQMRWDCLGAIGNKIIKTPNLDKLAERGVLFKNAFTPNPICIPARATLLTGNYSFAATGKKQNSGAVKEGQPKLTETLKSVGYKTYALGKLHYDPYSPPGEPREVHGFEHVELHESGRILAKYDPKGELDGVEDYFDYLKTVGWRGHSRSHGVGNNDVRPCPSPLPKEHHVDHWVADRTLAALDSHMEYHKDKPFFIKMSSPKPHSPYDPPRPYDTMYDPRDIPKPWGDESHLKDKNPHIESVLYSHATKSMSPEAWQVSRSYYYGNISFIDEMVGRVMTRLEELKVIDNTIVMFICDHGDLIGDFQSTFKTNHLNGSVRIPFIMAGPGVKDGCISEALVGLQDIHPTLAAMAGTEIGQEVHGVNLSDTLANPETVKPREWIYSCTKGGVGGQSSMITDGKIKYIYSEGEGCEELYDQEKDIEELYNLAKSPEHQELLIEMRQKLREEAIRLGDTELIDGDGFAKKEVDREKFKQWGPGGIGWRWY